MPFRDGVRVTAGAVGVIGKVEERADSVEVEAQLAGVPDKAEPA